jgi:hypothetical protein
VASGAPALTGVLSQVRGPAGADPEPQVEVYSYVNLDGGGP